MMLQRNFLVSLTSAFLISSTNAFSSIQTSSVVKNKNSFHIVKDQQISFVHSKIQSQRSFGDGEESNGVKKETTWDRITGPKLFKVSLSLEFYEWVITIFIIECL